MNMLLWQAAVLPDKALAFEHFANTSLLSFYQQQTGCLGVSFFQHGHQLLYLSYWCSNADAQQMLHSQPYQQMLNTMQQQWLVSCNPAQYAEIQGGFIQAQALHAIGSQHTLVDESKP